MGETVAIIDYGSGNLRSVQKALQRAATETATHVDVIVTADPHRVAAADRLVLPGVGAFRSCFQGLEAEPGLLEAMREHVHRAGRPFLGVCVGMQLLASRGHEYGQSAGLGWIDGDVRPLADLAGVRAAALKVPHMGWNDVQFSAGDKGGPGTSARDDAFYFAHSFYFDVEKTSDIMATCAYGEDIPVAVRRGNIMGFQFHPEKSQAAGIALLGGFLAWRP